MRLRSFERLTKDFYQKSEVFTPQFQPSAQSCEHFDEEFGRFQSKKWAAFQVSLTTLETLKRSSDSTDFTFVALTKRKQVKNSTNGKAKNGEKQTH